MAGEITTALTELKKRQAELATNLTAMGQPTDVSEPLDVQIPKVLNIETGGVTIAESDINFYDYDGTLVESWTLAQARVATALPDGLTHDGLVFQGWNWSLEDINALAMPMDVGAMYTTESGRSEFDITLTVVTGLIVTMEMYNESGHFINARWGDGSTSNPLTATVGVKTLTHTYTEYGEYTISVDSPGTYCPYSSSGAAGIFGTSGVHICKAIRIGDRCTHFGKYSFYQFKNLRTITIPSSLSGLGSNGNSFYFCTSLKSITIPPGIAAITTSSFKYCTSLKHAMLPNSITDIDISAFESDYGLEKITIPSSVTSIGKYAFQYCYICLEYYMNSIIPPTLAAADVFQSINGLCIIYVQQDALEEYQVATNLTGYKKYMIAWEEAA